jgi:SAM-dependent methyltransferase
MIHQAPEPLELLANFSFENAPRLCKPEHGCLPYHQAWTTLRWIRGEGRLPAESDFFVSQFRKHTRGEHPRILISGSADSGLVAVVLSAYWGSAVRPKLVLVDLCETVIEQVRLYSREVGFEIELHAQDILGADIEPVDFIFAHNFVRFLPKEKRPNLFQLWCRLLKPDGKLMNLSNVEPDHDPAAWSASADDIEERLDQLMRQARGLGLYVTRQAELERVARAFVNRRPTPFEDAEDIYGYLDFAGLRLVEKQLIMSRHRSSPQNFRRADRDTPRLCFVAQKS